MKKQTIICMISILLVVNLNRMLPHNLPSAAARLLLGSACIIQALLLLKEIRKRYKEGA